jgi:hypothetical protein
VGGIENGGLYLESFNSSPHFRVPMIYYYLLFLEIHQFFKEAEGGKYNRKENTPLNISLV